jgi:hypothetical protein
MPGSLDNARLFQSQLVQSRLARAGGVTPKKSGGRCFSFGTWQRNLVHKYFYFTSKTELCSNLATPEVSQIEDVALG